MLIDSHCHLADPAFDPDRDAVLERARAAGVGVVIVVADGLDSTLAALSLAEAHPECRATAGLHPHRAREFSPQLADRLAELMLGPGVVAVGETGLDYHYEHSPREAQWEAFAWHLRQSARTGKAAIVHSREADQDVSRLIEEGPISATAVLHSFSGGPELLETALARGFFVSFSGMVTLKSWSARWAVERVPDELLLVETDAPYLAPVPHRGKRNEPAFLAATVARVAELRGTTPEHVAQVTSRNAIRLFGLADCVSAIPNPQSPIANPQSPIPNPRLSNARSH